MSKQEKEKEIKNLPTSYSIRINAFSAWCKKEGKTFAEIERAMFLPQGRLYEMLKNKEKFDKTQITRLVYLMGARNAFFAIHFPSFAFRKRVYRQLFGRELPTKERKYRKGGEKD